MPYYQPVSQILTTPGDLQPLLERSRYLATLTQLLREAIDPVIAEHITLTNLRDDAAIITADTPAWLTNVRYLAPTLLQLLQQRPGLEKLRQIQFKVQPAGNSETTIQTVRRANLSSKSAQVLTDAASAIEDPELSAALRRLSHHAQQNSQEES